MNTQFKVKLLSHLNKKNQNKGFTLIELLVVVIIVGVLAAIALPNLLGQVAKGRQAEAKNNLGSINRAQQAYRLEKATFGSLSQLPVVVGQGPDASGNFVAQYYVFADGSATPSAESAAQAATARTDAGPDGNTTYTNDIRDYSSGVAQDDAGVYGQIICEGNTPADAVADPTGLDDPTALDCPDDSTKVE